MSKNSRKVNLMDKIINGYNSLSVFEIASYTGKNKKKNIIPNKAIMEIQSYNNKKRKKISIWKKIIAFFTSV